MLEFLKPPTDNLYKFVALAGLLLLIVSLVAPGVAIVNLEWKRLAAVRELNITQSEIEQSKQMELGLQSAKSMVEAALAESNAATLESDLARKERTTPAKKLKALKTAVEKMDKATSNLSEAQKQLQQKLDAYGKVVQDVQMRTIDNEYQGEILNTVSQMEFLSEVLALGGGSLGSLIALGGFILWYRKVQVFQDKILARDAQIVLESSKA